MLRKSVVVAAFLLLACGGPAPVPEATTPADDPAVAVVTPAPVLLPLDAKGLSTAPADVKKSSADPLAQTLELAAGDLHVVFTNNLDGEIDPCG